MSEVREVVAAEVAAVRALVVRVLAEFGLVFGEGSETDTQIDGLPASYAANGGRFWVATEDQALLGCVGVFPLSPGSFELRKMYLDPQARGHGVGKQLLEVAVAWVREQGGTRIVLDTIEEMTRAIAFYESHGFVRDDCQVRGRRCSRGYSRQL